MRECGKNGVARLKLGDIEVEFKDNSVAKEPGPAPMSVESGPIPEEPVQSDEKTKYQLMDEESLMEFEKAHQLAIDPVGYETDQIRAQIEQQRVEGLIDEEAEA